MAQKLITALQPIANVSDTVNFPGDDTIQTYRVTALQLKNYVLAPGNIIRNMLSSAVQELLVPPGIISAYGGTTAPDGWLFCVGSAISRTTYADLFAIIGTSHGSGDGSSTFNLPDMRGAFIRGVNGGSGRDPDVASRTASGTGGSVGDNVGSQQGHAFQTHTHIQNSHYHNVQYGGSGSAQRFSGVANDGLYGGTGSPSYFTAIGVTATNQNAAASGGQAQASANETRPLNIAENFIIKF